jgi:NAD(P)-dependent dehydrogenase (short-subunit alcohol dehydrogenase family)
MQDKIVLVTGATDGIGKQIALELAQLGATVLLHGRSAQRGQQALEDIRAALGPAARPRLDFFLADLSSQRQVRQLAAEVQAKYDRLHVLINNAGVFTKRRELTEDGLELTFAVNHLAPFLLTNLLLDLLKRSAPARVITLSSVLHQRSLVDFNNLQGERFFDGNQAYGLSKLGNVLFTVELAQRLRGTGVTANCLHPGSIDTKMLRAAFGGMHGDSVVAGAATPVYLATAPEVEAVSGFYFDKWCSQSKYNLFNLHTPRRAADGRPGRGAIPAGRGAGGIISLNLSVQTHGGEIPHRQGLETSVFGGYSPHQRSYGQWVGLVHPPRHFHGQWTLVRHSFP